MQLEEITEEVIEAAARGEVVAFEAIYRASFRFVVNVAFRVVNRLEDAEEVAQEVFMKIYEKLPSFRQESSLKTWVYRITLNTALNYAKKTSRVEKKTTEFLDVFSSTNGTEVEEREAKELNQRLVMSLLDRLNPDQRACMTLRSFEGMSYEKIAETLGVPVNTVRSRIKRARETMIALRNEVTQNEM